MTIFIYTNMTNIQIWQYIYIYIIYICIYVYICIYYICYISATTIRNCVGDNYNFTELFFFCTFVLLITISYVLNCVGRYVVMFIDKAGKMLIRLFVFCLFNNSIRVGSFWSLHEEWFNAISQFGNFPGFIIFSVLPKERSEVYEPNFISRMFSKILRGQLNVG